MNQKQRDLLCKMLIGRADALKRQLDRHFLLDNITSYSLLSTLGDGPETLAQLSPPQQKRFAKLAAKSKKLHKEKESLNNEMNSFYEEVNKAAETQSQVKKVAKLKLNNAMESAIVNIQFADDAEQAQNILASLPSMAQLLEE